MMIKKGFTLIELLVVVAILGILAAVLLMGLNPVEQMKRARDAGRITRAKELIGAAERWYIAAETEPACADLVLKQELKTGFLCTGLTLAGSGGSYTVSFTPESAAYARKCGTAEVGTETCIVPTELATSL